MRDEKQLGHKTGRKYIQGVNRERGSDRSENIIWKRAWMWQAKEWWCWSWCRQYCFMGCFLQWQPKICSSSSILLIYWFQSRADTHEHTCSLQAEWKIINSCTPWSHHSVYLITALQHFFYQSTIHSWAKKIKTIKSLIFCHFGYSMTHCRFSQFSRQWYQ